MGEQEAKKVNHPAGANPSGESQPPRNNNNRNRKRKPGNYGGNRDRNNNYNRNNRSNNEGNQNRERRNDNREDRRQDNREANSGNGSEKREYQKKNWNRRRPAEETVEDIRKDNERIEKDIWLEIASIHSVKLD